MEDLGRFQIVLWFIILELVIITLFIFLTYFYRIYFNFKEKGEESKRLKITTVLNNIIEQNMIKEIPYHRHVDVIIDIFLNFDEIYKDSERWNNLKNILMRDQILPYARKLIDKKDWYPRYLLVQCFRYYIDTRDEDLVIKLVNDPVPVVSINAIPIGITFGTQSVLKAIIYRLKKESHSLQILHTSSLDSSLAFREVIKQELLINTDPETKQICYNILTAMGTNQDIFEFAKKDVASEQLELKIAAIPVLFAADNENALPILFMLLQDKNWQVRNTIVKTIGSSNLSGVTDHLAIALNDESWWVRINAAKSLARLGDEGLSILKRHELTEQTYGYQETEYFLKIRSLKAPIVPVVKLSREGTNG